MAFNFYKVEYLNIRKYFAVTSACFFASCGPGENSTNKMAEKENEQKFDDTKMERDADFATEAASGGMMEVELGNIAATNAGSAQVKEFGKTMVTDHSKGNEELKAMAQAKNVTLPAAPDAKKQKMIDDLKAKTGADFDKAYMKMMVDDHHEDIDLFQKEADKGHDAEMKSWASRTVPMLQHHLMMAEEINKGLK